MKAFNAAATIGGVLLAGLAFAQNPPAQQAPPAQTPPAAQKPPALPAPPPAPLVFPEGSKYAFMNIQLVASQSAEGKASSARIEALRQKKANELNERNKQLEAAQAKLRSSVLDENARAQIQKDIDKQQVDIQRLTQDAQAELQELQNELQIDFQRKLAPIVELVAKEKNLQLLFSQADSGLVWADPGLDLTAEIIRRFDAATAAAAPKK